MGKEGRPTVFDKTTLQKLEEAFSNGASDEQACFLANISPSSLYNYQKAHPEFLERKNALKEMIKYQAKKVIRKAIEENNVEVAQWYLQRKAKDEFSERTELTGANGERLIPTPEEREQSLEAIKKFLSNQNGKDNDNTGNSTK